MMLTAHEKPRYACNRWFWKCLACEHPVSALTAGELDAQMVAHYAHIHGTVDRTIDPHFEDERMDRLIAQ